MFVATHYDRSVATKPKRRAASYVGLRPASARTSAIASAGSRKRDTRAEVALRRALWRRGFRYRVDVASLPGRPDIVFAKYRLVVFCDGDFWHGRGLARRLAKLTAGHNAGYWVEKISGNVRRDRRNDRALRRSGWKVVRCWETDVLRDVDAVASRIATILRGFV